jgi:hypothetical protein
MNGVPISAATLASLGPRVGRPGVRGVAHRGEAPEEFCAWVSLSGLSLREVCDRRAVLAPEGGVRGLGIDSIGQGPHELGDDRRTVVSGQRELGCGSVRTGRVGHDPT